LIAADVLTRKKSKRSWKYALGDKAIIQAILDSKAFGNNRVLQNYFGRDNALISARLLEYNE
jgi:hypothetical protein